MGMALFTHSHSRGRTSSRIRVLALCVGFVGACHTKNDSNPGTKPDPKPGTDGGVANTMPDAEAPAAFAPATPAVYGSKVKNLLTGLPLTEAELGQLTANPQTMPMLVDAWMATPQWKEGMLDFFRQAFQQTQTDIADYEEQLGRTTNPWNNQDKILFVRAAEESFARTAREIVLGGQPFTEVLTTNRLMLNPPLMSSYAFIDAFPQDDLDNPIPKAIWLRTKYPDLVFVRTNNPDANGVQVPIPLEDSINPASPNFMKWYDPNPYQGMNLDKCQEPEKRMGVQAFVAVADFLFGGRAGCGSTQSQFTPADWNAWRMVTIRQPKAGEERTIYWDLPKLRNNATELVLTTPRVGFMTTLAFFANWPTNASNSYRVVTNQSLIVALGRGFDDTGTTVQVNETSVDGMHVKPGTTCYGCHSTLDPMRDFFRQSYSIAYSTQLLPLQANGIPDMATFTVENSDPVKGTGVSTFAGALAQHPRFATAWTQKLCQFANSTSCLETDPEFVRVATAFRDSKFNFRTLVRELLSSPLVTFASKTKTAEQNGVSIGINRREALCAALEARLQLPDFCALKQATPGVKNVFVNTARNLALSVPGAGYARGDESPLLPHDPNLFFSAATENLCSLMAAQLVDPKGGGRYASAKKDEAIRDFVATVMGLPPNDPRAPTMLTILNEHHADAVRTGASPTDALRSTFTLACESPLAVSTGL